MISKIIYIHEAFYRKHRDMGVEVFRKKGYEIELWSTVKIKYKDKLEIPTDNTEDRVMYFRSHLRLVREIFRQDWGHTIAFFTTTPHRGGIEDFVRIMIGSAGGRYCNFIYEIAPIGECVRNKSKDFKQRLLYFFNQYKLKIYQTLIKNFFRPIYCFVPTYQATKHLLTDWEKEVVVEVHNKDYDEYLSNNFEEKKENYILFIDSDMVNPEDFRKSNTLGIYPDKDIYYGNMKRAFKRLEDYYGMPIYIAAHPKSEYTGEEFGKRKIFYYQTCKLVQNAELVLSHASVAFNFIVLYKKPYIFLVDRYIKRHMVWRYLTLPLIKELRAITYDFGTDMEPWKYINEPNKNLDAYFKKYIKHTKDNGKLFYEIVEERIRQI